MKLDEASAFFKNLIIESDNKTEIKIYKNFISIFTDLNNRDLSEEQLKSIEEKLDSLNFNENSDNRKKHFKQKLNLFVGYLKEKLSLISKGYYSAIGMSLGMSFGVAFGAAFKNVSYGLIFGMLIGMLIGIAKDSKAKKEGKVLSTNL
ncbi:hypothetical protein [Croceibacter atlanticus]|jgi:hypothetical protein|uniref:hypothetical protein n=1 Tax=Croceibacter atlanticus TaxID=313588 RepID=UPI0024BA48E2|nr:hypothetical protein [Croceibacter atlanticus]|tara:strand:+ start:217 stop:660 length:444 start_codon:yes stop_codon:yes gene_type:complete